MVTVHVILQPLLPNFDVQLDDQLFDTIATHLRVDPTTFDLWLHSTKHRKSAFNKLHRRKYKSLFSDETLEYNVYVDMNIYWVYDTSRKRFEDMYPELEQFVHEDVDDTAFAFFTTQLLKNRDRQYGYEQPTLPHSFETSLMLVTAKGNIAKMDWTFSAMQTVHDLATSGHLMINSRFLLKVAIASGHWENLKHVLLICYLTTDTEQFSDDLKYVLHRISKIEAKTHNNLQEGKITAYLYTLLLPQQTLFTIDETLPESIAILFARMLDVFKSLKLTDKLAQFVNTAYSRIAPNMHKPVLMSLMPFLTPKVFEQYVLPLFLQDFPPAELMQYALEHYTTQDDTNFFVLVNQIRRLVPIDHVYPNGDTMLHHSIKSGNLPLFEHLLTLRASFAIPDHNGETVWDLICQLDGNDFWDFATPTVQSDAFNALVHRCRQLGNQAIIHDIIDSDRGDRESLETFIQEHTQSQRVDKLDMIDSPEVPINLPSNWECSICGQDSTDNLVWLYPCGHGPFHNQHECILEHGKTCPLCRAKIEGVTKYPTRITSSSFGKKIVKSKRNVAKAKTKVAKSKSIRNGAKVKAKATVAKSTRNVAKAKVAKSKTVKGAKAK